MSMDDRDLDKVFERLAGYETEQEGITWSDVEKELIPKRRRISAVYWLLAAAAVFMITGGTWLMKWAERGKSKDSVSSEKQVSNHPARPTGLPPKVSEPDRPVKSDSALGLTKNADKGPTKVERQADEVPAGNLPVKSLRKNPEVVALQPITFEVNSTMSQSGEAAAMQSDIDSSKTLLEGYLEVAEEMEHHPENSYLLLLDGSYVFGMIKPNQRDRDIVSDFKQKPAFSLQAELLFNVNRTRDRFLRGGLIVRSTYKEFSFMRQSVVDDRAVRLEEHLGGWVHQVGASMAFASGRSGIIGQVSLLQSIGRSRINSVWADRVIVVGLRKFVSQREPWSRWYVGVDASVYAVKAGGLFYYLPMQISMGYSPKFRKRK